MVEPRLKIAAINTKVAEQSGRFTIFSLVDALTKRSGRMSFAGERAETDAKASAVLTLVAT